MASLPTARATPSRRARITPTTTGSTSSSRRPALHSIHRSGRGYVRRWHLAAIMTVCEVDGVAARVGLKRVHRAAVGPDLRVIQSGRGEAADAVDRLVRRIGHEAGVRIVPGQGHRGAGRELKARVVVGRASRRDCRRPTARRRRGGPHTGRRHDRRVGSDPDPAPDPSTTTCSPTTPSRLSAAARASVHVSLEPPRRGNGTSLAREPAWPSNRCRAGARAAGGSLPDEREAATAPEERLARAERYLRDPIMG